MPARALLIEPATVLAVWYQANADATDFSPPCSAIRALTEGSRRDMDNPCALRMAKSSHGALAKPKRSETRLRKLIAATKEIDRKSTRLNSSHSSISYAVFCLKKKKKKR